MQEEGWQYFRICFAAVDEAEVESASKRFVAACRSFWTKKNLDDIDESSEVMAMDAWM